MSSDRTTTYLFRDIPPELWQQAKHLAVDRGISLRQLLLDSLRDFIDRREG